jgi:6,7-dimethyl-8-ribityllumazine synthase
MVKRQPKARPAGDRIKAHVLLAVARFYDDIADELVLGATRALQAAGASWEIAEVPGAFELPAAIGFAGDRRRRKFDGYVALGCVIRGETSHYDYVCGESARGLMNLAVERRLAIGYGILTVDTAEQAWERAKVDRQDKGGDAVRACLAMIRLRRHFAAAAGR